MRRTHLLPLPLLLCCFALADEDKPKDDTPKPAEAGTLVVIDAKGKEQKLKAWTFEAGTRRLAFLVAGQEAPKPKKRGRAPRGNPAGPEALVIRDELTIFYVDGVLTWIPLTQVRSLSYDNKKQTVSVRVAVSDKASDDVTLTGTTRY